MWITTKLSHPLLAPLKGSISSSRCERCVRGTRFQVLNWFTCVTRFPRRYNPEVGDLVIGRITEVCILLMLVFARHNERR